ncbi:MAG: sodium:solute symporter [Bacteroidales bacterium]|jgi:Na+/proline symporter|nr:sodium:solute symporter [Bacteroidales bacterium]
MNPIFILLIIFAYFGLLLIVSHFTSKNVNNKSYFLGDRKSPWGVIAVGMLGASISGVTFISVPGWVQSTQMTYMQMVFGFVLGYVVIAFILLPVYYKINQPSIYFFLGNRFGVYSHKTAAFFFFISRFLISALRLFVMVNVIQIIICNNLGIPFWLTTIIVLLMIWLYTFKGGIKTIIWTDLLQTIFMMLALILTIIIVSKKLDFGFADVFSSIYHNPMSKMFEFSDWTSKQHFAKQFISGALVTIAMTGLDQDMMQKNLSCKNLKEAKKNVLTYGLFFIPANFLFLSLGILLMIFAQKLGFDINETLIKGDNLFPFLAQNYLGNSVLILFLIGLTASTFASSDSAITALTTTFTLDILNKTNKSDIYIKKTRFFTQIGISSLMAILVVFFYYFNSKSIIDAIYVVASYAYGPLLGLFVFGLITKKKIKDKLVPIVAIVSPILCFAINCMLKYFFEYSMGYELLLLNGIFTFVGLLMSKESRRLNV